MTTTTPSNAKAVPIVQLPVDLRDYLAAKAMQAMVAQRCYPWDKHTPQYAYAIADAMLREREVNP